MKYPTIIMLGCLFASGAIGRSDAVLAAERKAKVLRIGHTLAEDSHYGVGLKKFADLVKAKTDGTLHVEVSGNSKLGNERDLIEGVSLGTIEMCLVSTGTIPSFSKEFMVFDLPFIVQDRKKIYRTLDGETGREMLDSLGGKGIKGMVFFENGFRNITDSRRPINTPADLAGLKIRVMENPVHLETFRVLGANASPMPFGELFTALQQKIMDGQENPLFIIKTSRFHEVQKYLALTEHVYSPAVMMIGNRVYAGLTGAQRKALMDAAREARDFERKFIIDNENRIIAELKRAGMVVTSPDKAVFRKAVEPVYRKFEAEIGKALIDKVRDS